MAVDSPPTGAAFSDSRFRHRHHRQAQRINGTAGQPALVVAPAPLPDADPSAELVLPAVDARLLARRAALPVLAAVVVAVVLIVTGAPTQAITDALSRALNADARWVVAGAVFELLSFAGYIGLLWLVAERATPRLGLKVSAQVTLGGAAATRLLPAGGLGGVAMTIWALRRTGLDSRTATRTLLIFLVLLYSVFLGAIAVAGGLLAFGAGSATGPLSLSAAPAAAASLGIVLALALAAHRPASGAPPAPTLPDTRLQRARAGLAKAPASFGGAVRDATSVLRHGDVRLLGAFVWWGFDAAVLWAMLHALGTPPALSVVVLGYFVGQVANTLPIPGAVSGGMVGVLLAFGVSLDLALASVLAYRAVAIWLPTPIGLLALRGLRRTVADWSREDAAVPATAVAPVRVLAVTSECDTPRPAAALAVCP